MGRVDRLAFLTMFAADWFLGQANVGKVLPRRWETIQRRLLTAASRNREGRVHAVDRRSGLTPQEFREEYFLTGIPVVLEGAAAEWPALKKWTLEYLSQQCGEVEVPVLDGRNWTVNRGEGTEVVSTAENRVHVEELLKLVKDGSPWYGTFMELLNAHADLRRDLDLSFVEKFGHANPRIPWQRNVLAKMYVGGPNTSTSLHCAGISNLFVQISGRKKWVLIAPGETPFMYPATSKGLNWQSRVDFRNPDYAGCPLYRYVDRYETVLEPGDVLWNPPFVWHGVINLTESIAVSLWWTNVRRAFSNNFLFSALTLCGTPNPIALQLGISRANHNKTSNFNVHLNR